MRKRLTLTELKKLAKGNNNIMLSDQYYFDTESLMDKSLLPDGFYPGNESSYKLLGGKNRVYQELDKDQMLELLRNVHPDTGTEFEKTEWIREGFSVGLCRMFESKEGIRLFISERIVQVMGLQVVRSDTSGSREDQIKPVQAFYGLFYTMPVYFPADDPWTEEEEEEEIREAVNA